MDLGKSLLVSKPLQTLMDFISQVETCRQRLHLKSRSLELFQSKSRASADTVREMNWSLFSGERAMETLRDFTTLLTAAPDNELYQACRVSFADVLPHAFPALCDAWRRMWVPTQKIKNQILAVGLMTLQEAERWFKQLSEQPMCCAGDPFVQVGFQTGYH